MNTQKLRSEVKALIEIFRQAGHTSTVVQATRNSNAYLVVQDQADVQKIVKNYPDLTGRVFSIKTLLLDLRGRSKAPLLFDADAVNMLCSDVPMPTIVRIEGDSENQPTFEDLEKWRAVFEQAQHDKDFKVFTHEGIELESNGTITIKSKSAVTLHTKEHKHQINVKLTEEDIKMIDEINKDFFEGEATNSMLGRILLRKGISVYNKLKSML